MTRRRQKRFCWRKCSVIIAVHFQHVNQDLLVTVQYKSAKETAFSRNNQPEKHHHGIFSHVSAKNGVSRQLNVNKSHDIQFPWAAMPSKSMTIAGLSESLPPAKISVSTATAHGGGFSSLFRWFSLSILQGFYVHVGLVQNMRFRCGNLVKTRLKKNPFNCCQFRSRATTRNVRRVNQMHVVGSSFMNQ
jgi:hypothetical protein